MSDAVRMQLQYTVEPTADDSKYVLTKSPNGSHYLVTAEEYEAMKADKKRLDWLEEQYGIGLVHDDDSQWAVAGNGFQNVRIDKEGPLESTFFVEEDEFADSARAAIDKIMAEETP